MENKARSQELKNFIREHAALFWYLPDDKGETVSDELLVESVLNYGTLNNIRDFFKITGIHHAAAIFRQMTGRKSKNIYPELRNYFELYFNKYVP